VPLFDCSGQSLHNVKGLPTGIRLPQHFCGYDPDAFLLELEDDQLAPLVFRGDWVIVSPKTPVQPDEIGVLHDGLRFWLRKYCKLGGMVAFHSSATRFPGWTLQELPERGITVVGRALRVINRELSRQLDRLLVVEEVRGVDELRGLRADRRRQLRVAVADRHDGDARAHVQVLATRRIAHAHALALGEDDGCLAIVREQRTLCGFD
jgi:hypothetical protein